MTRRKPTVDLDRLDLAILRRWQADTQKPAKVIADAVGLSTAAVQRRLKRLREAGVIRREMALLDPTALGLAVTCIVTVDLDREREPDLARFRKRIDAAPEVQQCYYVTGKDDFVLIVLVPDMVAYEAFTHRVLLSDDNVRNFTTLVVLDRTKVGLDIAVPDDSDPPATRRARKTVSRSR